MIQTRKRFQKGSLSKRGKRWVGQWWETGHRRKRTLGQVSEMTKSQAQAELAGILAPVNAGRTAESIKPTFGEFVEHTYLPFYRGYHVARARDKHVFAEFPTCNSSTTNNNSYSSIVIFLIVSVSPLSCSPNSATQALRRASRREGSPAS